MAKTIRVCKNDSTDADNLATAEVFTCSNDQNPLEECNYVFEPRHVLFGSYMTPERRDGCIRLIQTHFPSLDAKKTLLHGALRQSDLDQLEGLSEDDLELLRFAVKPPSGPPEDAMTHALLMALDFASVMRCRSSRPIKIFVDRDALAGLESPINLHAHHHEELVARTEKELAEFQDIMNGPLSERTTRHRSWYHRILHKKLKEHQDAVHILDIDSFCQTLKTAEKVIFFEGASLGLLERLMRKGVGSNMDCYLQAGTYNPTLNLLDNSFNIELNPKAAKFVFSNFRQLSSLTLIPTDTTKQVEYSLIGLQDLSPSIAKSALAFNCHVDAMELATGAISVEDFPQKKVILADLTAYLLAFTPFFKTSFLEFANMVDKGGQFVLESSETGISVLRSDRNVVVEEPKDLLKSLTEAH